jgi:Fic family protein
MKYNWQQKDWPNFQYDLSELEELLFQLAEGQGRLIGLIQGLPDEIQEQSIIDIMVSEAVKTSAIEGEYISREDVISSIRNRLGLNRIPENIKDKRAEGLARLMVAVREGFAEDLTETMLFEWHTMMMEPYFNINKGQWRSGQEPMQIISGSVGREVIHFEAPPSDQVAQEMNRFMQWFNATAPNQSKYIFHAPVRSAIAHVYFESIHPFEDGNGRIGRALSEKALAQGAGRPVLISLSNAIETKRQAYYEALKAAQRSNEITPWITYFIHTISEAQQMVIHQISFTITKGHFFDKYADQLNARQEKVLNRMFEAGPGGFEGGMSAKKYVSITKTSKATATRDLQALVNMGALLATGGGRSTRYELNKGKK